MIAQVDAFDDEDEDEDDEVAAPPLAGQGPQLPDVDGFDDELD